MWSLVNHLQFLSLDNSHSFINKSWTWLQHWDTSRSYIKVAFLYTTFIILPYELHCLFFFDIYTKIERKITYERGLSWSIKWVWMNYNSVATMKLIWFLFTKFWIRCCNWLKVNFPVNHYDLQCSVLWVI